MAGHIWRMLSKTEDEMSASSCCATLRFYSTAGSESYPPDSVSIQEYKMADIVIT